MKNATKRDIEELVVRSSRVPGLRNTYSIGPFGYRAGFLFQQQKAINLVHSLITRHTERDLKRSRICIIGGGIAGTTTLVALSKKGINATLYEKRNEFLSIQNDAHHRLVHPNYNRWPMLDGLQNFTSLPVMNWFAAPAPIVIQQLKEEFARHQIEQRWLKPQKECVSIEEDDKGKVEVTFTDGKIVECDICIVASGFGSERYSEKGFPGYWQDDTSQIDGALTKKETCIFGTGDGALIDAIRCCSKNTRSFWEIPLGVISYLRDERYLSISERKFSTSTGNPTLDEVSHYEEEIRDHENSISAFVWITSKDQTKLDEISSTEREFYEGFVDKHIPDGSAAQLFLEKRLKKTPPDTRLVPQIFGLHRSPFEPTSAPINKILVAYLLKSGRLRYVHAESRKTTIEKIEHISSQSRMEASSRVDIVRFGPEYPVKTLAKDNSVPPTSKYGDGEVSVLSVLSGVSVETYAETEAFTSFVDLDKVGHDRDSIAIGLAKENEKLVDWFAKDVLKCDGAAFIDIDSSRNWAFSFDYTTDDKKPNPEKLRTIGGIERSVFGFPVVLRGKAVAGNVNDVLDGFRE
jgi:hypothetical protein